MNLLHFHEFTFTVNITMTTNMERRCTGINRMWISGSTMNIMMANKTERRCTGINRMWITRSEFKRFTDIYNTIRWTNNVVYSFTNTFNIITTRTDRITTYRTITNVLIVTYSNRRDRRQTCMQWTRCSTNKRSTWQKSRLSIRLKNIIWLKRKHTRFESKYKQIFITQ